MEDKQLLELAAKAAGLKAQYSDNWGDFSIGEPYSKGEVRWNPLTFDHDAFRLMVALSLDVEFDGPTGVRVNYVGGNGRLCTVEQLILEDLAEAVRRTIVRAAAELGKDK
ncbi:hypothetical protein [Pseudomonas vranovensis]|uniref:hypothetical protein n=1 Tax=Pseudomonas vranovensis TaxID=321661 RepID=UPI003D969947